jgi:hypothetical protein
VRKLGFRVDRLDPGAVVVTTPGAELGSREAARRATGGRSP